ncbi:hypothetical protein M8818_000688 [Zalaria obscura]|uniref:Uncharacterized protein n=1 Tax=Zalaria obscura TaxID=2024903 RepID=A0ACC3SLY9_9PEZI
MLAIIGASGKLGNATLTALLKHNLIPSSDIICLSSSGSGTQKLQSQGVTVRSASFDTPSNLESALRGCDRLFLVSSPRIAKDFNNAPPGAGREADHFVAIDAARRAGVKHIYYSSLAFANPSKAGVMQAHMRTEAYLAKLNKEEGLQYTVIREGLYNESWPLYFGHYDVGGDDRTEVPVGGDGRISWTSIADLGLANALVLAADPKEWEGRTFYLSNTQDPRSLEEVAKMVGKAKGREIALRVVSREQHERYYVEERKMPEPMIKWWSTTYDALRDNECEIKDTTLETLLASKGVTPKPVEETIKEMIAAA